MVSGIAPHVSVNVKAIKSCRKHEIVLKNTQRITMLNNYKMRYCEEQTVDTVFTDILLGDIDHYINCVIAG